MNAFSHKAITRLMGISLLFSSIASIVVHAASRVVHKNNNPITLKNIDDYIHNITEEYARSFGRDMTKTILTTEPQQAGFAEEQLEQLSNHVPEVVAYVTQNSFYNKRLQNAVQSYQKAYHQLQKALSHYYYILATKRVSINQALETLQDQLEIGLLIQKNLATAEQALHNETFGGTLVLQKKEKKSAQKLLLSLMQQLQAALAKTAHWAMMVHERRTFEHEIAFQKEQEHIQQAEKLQPEKATYACGDIEGKWHKVTSFVAQCDGAIQIINDDPEHFQVKLKDGARFVFLGDAIDGGKEDEKVLRFLIYLKKEYGNRVTLIIGNRDANKMRLFWELTKEALDMKKPGSDTTRVPAWEKSFEKWINNPENLIIHDGKEIIKDVKYMWGKGDERQTLFDKIIKFRWILTDNMGAGGTFNNWKEKIGTQSDIVTYERYMNVMLKPVKNKDTGKTTYTGLIPQYLKAAQVIDYDPHIKTLFMHGGISPENLGSVPEQPKMPVTNQSELQAWIKALNTWAQNCVTNALASEIIDGTKEEALPFIEKALPLVAYAEPLLDDKGEKWTGENNTSVTLHRPWNKEGSLVALDENTALILTKANVHQQCLGHTPIGDYPALTKNKKSNFCTVICDTTYAAEPRNMNAALKVTPQETTVYTNYYGLKNGEFIQRLIYGSQNHLVGTSFEEPGKDSEGNDITRTWWYIAPLNNEKMLVCSWLNRRTTYKEYELPKEPEKPKALEHLSRPKIKGPEKRRKPTRSQSKFKSQGKS